MIMKRITYIFIAFLLSCSLGGCFRDLGNYDYTAVNEAVIGDKGFETPYNVRIDIDKLQINPEISFTEDSGSSGEYSYEWVAVGQNFYRGQRFTIGTERNLDYTVALSAEEYILYFKVKDQETGIVFSKSVELNVRALYSTGWILAGEDADGKGQADMVSISNDMLFLHNVLKPEGGLELSPVKTVWIDNDEYTSDNRLYAGTEKGSYKFSREEFIGSPGTALEYSFASMPETGGTVMTDNQKVGEVRQVIIVDKRAYIVSTDNGMIGNTISSYDRMTDFDTAGKMICNHTGVQGIRTFIFYDLESRRFCYISGLSVYNMQMLGDGENDTWSWDTRNDHDGGLEFVTAFNSFFSGGQGTAVMKNPSDGQHYIYCITAPRTGTPVKNGKYTVSSDAAGFGEASGYIITPNQGYMIYASGNTLYGYNFRKSPQEVTVLKTFDAPVTCLKADYESPEKNMDCFYAATYRDGEANSGTVYKFYVKDNPDNIEIQQKDIWDEGFLKIHSIIYKAF